jgi:hypothetical protein
MGRPHEAPVGGPRRHALPRRPPVGRYWARGRLTRPPSPLGVVDTASGPGAVRMGPKRSTRIPRKLWLAAALVVLSVLLAAQNSTVVVPEVNSYLVVNQRTITVKVAVAPCSWTRVTNVAETPTEVRVKVETLPCPIPLPSTAELAFRDLTVSFAEDLMTRVVRDANGQAVASQ